MESRSFYNEILTDHNLHPVHKEDIPDANLILEGLNPSCGDHIWLKMKVEDGIIKDGGFVGDGCAISQASADIMLDLIIGKKKEEAIQLAESFLRMIKGNATDEDMDALEEAGGTSGYFPYAGQSKMCSIRMAYHGRIIKKSITETAAKNRKFAVSIPIMQYFKFRCWPCDA